MELIEGLEKRRSALWNTRTAEWDPHYKELQRFIQPRLGRFNQSEVNRGKKLHGDLIDTTAPRSLDILVAGLSTGLTSPARPWFRLSTMDPDLMEFGPVKVWLYEVERRKRQIFQASNVYNALPQSYGELGEFGTGVTFWLRSFEKVLRGVSQTCGEYVLATNEEGIVDTVFRVYSPTVKQMVERFGDAVPARVRDMYDRGDYYKTHEVYHAVFPRQDRQAGKIDGTNMPIASVYWVKGEQKPLGVSGFADRPFTAARWHVTGMDTYGRSPGMQALGDAKQIQRQERQLARGEDKMINPPLVGPTALRTTGVSNVPGGITYIDGLVGQAPALRPAYEVRADAITAMSLSMDRTRERIEQAFFADLFLMISRMDDVRTATEVVARQEEKMLMLGPVLERIQGEMLDPLIDRTFTLMAEGGLLPPPPPELEGMPIRIDYVSTLAQAQRAVSTTSVERVAGFIGNLAAVKSDVIDKFDADQAVDEYADMIGIPPNLINSDDTVAEIRANRAQQQQAAQALATGREAAETAKVLSQADTRGGNALSAIAGIG